MNKHRLARHEDAAEDALVDAEALAQHAAVDAVPRNDPICTAGRWVSRTEMVARSTCRMLAGVLGDLSEQRDSGAPELTTQAAQPRAAA